MTGSLTGRCLRRSLAMLALMGAGVLGGILAVPAQPALAQVTGTIPSREYYFGIESLYRGDHRRAQRTFASEFRGSVKTAQTRWIDAICFRAMMGETLYQQAKYPEALVEFNHACQMALAYPNWLDTVKFTAPRADTNLARFRPPWGNPIRQVTYSYLPNTMLISQGRIDNSQQADRGGVIQTAQFWKLDVVEIIRCTALAIRRRNELLGPLAPHDRLSRELADVFGRKAGVRDWSNAWRELPYGLALMGMGKYKQAAPHLARATLLDGRYDHRLTGVALLAQADLARQAGASAVAANLYLEASYAGFSYEDFDVVAEALDRGRLHHESLGLGSLYPPLEAAANWANRDNLDHLQVLFGLGMADGLAQLRETKRGVLALKNAATRRRDLSQGRLALLSNYVQTALTAQQNSLDDASIERSLTLQASGSLRNFQIRLANDWFDSGQLPARLAVDVYPQLLGDPARNDWINDPIDQLAALRTDHQPGYQRWFAAAVARRDWPAAINVADQEKRRRYFLNQPMGGRLSSIRQTLQAEPGTLTPEQRLEVQSILVRYPDYAQASQRVSQAYAAAEAQADLIVDGAVNSSAMKDLKEAARGIRQREQLLRAVSLMRLPTSMSFPPVADADATRVRLQPGQAVLVFHQSGDSMHGFLMVNSGNHYWRLPDATRLSGGVTEALRAVGNFGQQKRLSKDELASEEWKEPLRQLSEAVLGESRLDLSKTTELVIVPDGPLWHAPFAAMLSTASGAERMLIEEAPLRYVPTLSLAFGRAEPRRPVRQTGILLPRPAGKEEAEEIHTITWDKLSGAMPSATKLRDGSPVPSALVAGLFDQLVVGTESEISMAAPFGWSPLPMDRGKGGAISAWTQLGGSGPQRLLLPGVQTMAANGMKGGRRGNKSGLAPGHEIFQASCAAIASGADTLLLSRWVTGGATQWDLIRELAIGLPERSAADAWRRSVSLGRTTMIDPAQEPRIDWRADDGLPPVAEHPFFWAGYLMIDLGFDPQPAVEVVGELKQIEKPKAQPPIETAPAAKAPRAEVPEAEAPGNDAEEAAPEEETPPVMVEPKGPPLLLPSSAEDASDENQLESANQD